MKEAVIVSAVRTAVGKSGRGTLVNTRPEDMAGVVLAEVIERAAPVSVDQVEDVIMGCAIPEAAQGNNIARVATLRAGLPFTVPAHTVNRFCSSGLQTIAHASNQIMAGMGSCVIAGGVESMSAVPMTSSKISLNLWMVENYPEIYIAMGMTAENVAEKYGVSREDQDAFAYTSHMRALAAQEAGKFDEEIVPLEISQTSLKGGELVTTTTEFKADEGPRRGTSIEALAKLRPVFAVNGTVTAGNSSQTSDGAAAVMVMEREKAESLGLKPLARFVGFAVGGVEPELMGIGPVVAIPRVLEMTGMSLEDIGLIELNEAFASQSIAVIRELGLDPEITNVNGGAIALGHPLGCTGTKLTVQLIHEMKRREVQYGMVSMCIGGGMGAAAIFENLQ